MRTQKQIDHDSRVLANKALALALAKKELQNAKDAKRLGDVTCVLIFMKRYHSLMRMYERNHK